MSEMSDIESVISTTSSSTALAAAAAANRKRKSGGSSGSAFSRNSYAKRRRKKIKQTQQQQLLHHHQTRPKSTLALTRQDSTKSSKASEDASESEDQTAIKSSDNEMNITSDVVSKSEVGDLGKGKRKRFQNVRMLPIEEVCRSPPRKK